MTDSGFSHGLRSAGHGLSLATDQPPLAAASQEVPVAGASDPPGYLRAAAGLLSRHRFFVVALTLATALRAAVIIGFQPMFWYPDSIWYLKSALDRKFTIAKPAGYSEFLAILQPLHSFTLVALLQHLMGLGTGIAIYALLRRRGLAGWAATLLALPVMFDAFQIQLEHMLMADTLFLFCMVLALVILCWNDRPSLPAAALAGLLLGYATLTRSTGLPLLAVVAACLLVRRAGWRSTGALVAAGVLPVAIYMTGFYAQRGNFAITNTDGIYLYNRVMSFADCAKIKPPPRLAVLCDPRPQSKREQPPIEYMWDYRDPLWRLAKHDDLFTPRINHLAMRFAERAILAQPLDYLSAVTGDTLRSFGWADPVPYDRSNQWYLFAHPYPIDRVLRQQVRRYQPDLPRPRAVQPIAGFLIGYQRWVYLRGTLTGLIMLIGLAGIAARWRSRGGLVLLPWSVAAVLLVLPPATAGFSMRYLLAVVPPACLAAGLAFARERTQAAPQQHDPAPDALGTAAATP
jgi:hypothetical protein